MPIKKKQRKQEKSGKKTKHKVATGRERNSAKKWSREEQEELPVGAKQPVLKEDLEILLDNFGHSLSEPILTGRTNQQQQQQQQQEQQQQDGSSSLIELSLRKYVYKKEKHHCRHYHANRGNSVDPTSSLTLPAAVDNTTTQNNDFTRECEDLLTGSSQCDCTENIYRSMIIDDGIFDSQRNDQVQYCTVCKQCNCENYCNCLDCDDCQLLQQTQMQQQSQQQQQQQQTKTAATDVNIDAANQYKDEVQGLRKEKINRYNLNHIQYSRSPQAARNTSRWSWLSFWNNKRNKNKYKNNLRYANGRNNGEEISSGSGVTIPQLYKANVSNTVGITPGKFTFRAVTGCPQWFDVSDVNYFKLNEASNKSNESKHYDHKFAKNNSNNDHNKTMTTEHGNKDTLLLDENHIKDEKIMKKHLKRSKDAIEMPEYVVSRSPPERIDIYCFDHLNTGYFRTSDHPPPLISDIAMERVEAHATRFWAEIFGFMHLFTAFIIAFILQLYKFLLYGIIRPLMVGLLQLTSDYFFKPLLTVIYNSITQPLFIFFYNIATSFRDLCLPIAKGIGYFFTEIATILKAIRLVDWKPTTVVGAASAKYNAKHI